MAESAASALLSVIFQKLTDEAFKKYARSQNIYSELKQLGITLSHIQALLNDASQKEITNESVRLWMNSLQHLAYDIDDVLDDVATEAMHRELTLESEASTSMVRKLIPTCCTKFTLSHRLSPKLDDINKKLQHLEKQKSDLGLIVKDEKPISTSRRDETSLLESDVVGREGEREKLIKKLLQDEPSKEKFIIVPIVGMGGVGKTTMARILYNDIRVKGHFELMAWVCVSDDFDILKISKTILQDVSDEIKEYENLNQVQMALTKQLKDKRFLLVLDDVWHENYDDWENLVRPFHSGAFGSKVIMTSRKEQLLKMLGFDNLDHLDILSSEDALCLFALHALGVDNFDSHPTLRPRGELIVGKCGGLPLALKAIGRLLRTKTDEEKWDDVLNSKIWDSESHGDLSAHWKTIVPALRLSYHDLLADLKRLFAYCSLFPKDFLFDKEELVLLWLAEGFLNRSNSTMSPERLGNEYFEELLSRSFFQHAPNDKSLFVMHDLMNDLATFVAGEFFSREDNRMAKEDLAKYRHMSFVRDNYVAYQKFEACKRAKGLRTLLAVYVGVDQGYNEFYLSRKILVDLLPELALLRVLSLSRFELDEVPDFIGTLKHLRYLNLSKTNIKDLPENVGNLYNLQTLIVFGCRRLTKLPNSFMKLKKLRHFDIRDTPLLKLPLGIGELKSLQTLTRIVIEGNSGFAITELKKLKDLQGEICIEGLNKVQSSMHARDANLLLKGINKLELKWEDGSRRETLDKEVLNELKPHSDKLKRSTSTGEGGQNLRSLTIWGNDMQMEKINNTRMPMLQDMYINDWRNLKSINQLSNSTHLTSLTIEDCQSMESFSDLQLSNLTRLVISDCESIESFPNLQLPNLTHLDIYSCKNMKEFGDLQLPNLTHLSIEQCKNMKEFGDLHIPKLISWVIQFCENLESFPDLQLSNLTMLKEVCIVRCPMIDSSFPRGLWPPNLSTLVVGGLKKRISEWGYQNFPASLVHLKLWGDTDPDVRNFSQLSDLFPSSLTTLEICRFNNLESLLIGLQHLTSLQHLFIWECPKLINLPETLLPSLLSLWIVECHRLKERCDGRGSHYWPQISHIPKIRI